MSIQSNSKCNILWYEIDLLPTNNNNNNNIFRRLCEMWKWVWFLRQDTRFDKFYYEIWIGRVFFCVCECECVYCCGRHENFIRQHANKTYRFYFLEILERRSRIKYDRNHEIWNSYKSFKKWEKNECVPLRLNVGMLWHHNGREENDRARERERDEQSADIGHQQL